MKLNRPGPAPQPVAIGDRDATMPKPPARLGREGTKLWREVTGELIRRRLWASMDAGQVERYCRACEVARQAREALTKEGGGFCATGSRGQAVRHPLVDVILSAEAQASRLADSLMMTPASRNRARVDAQPPGPGIVAGMAAELGQSPRMIAVGAEAGK